MPEPCDTDPAGRRPGRRSQPERRAAMQARLLDATVECLVELGWAKTSLPEVVARAGVGRGAQVHHFPTKAALMEAVGDHLLARHRGEFVSAFSALSPSERTPSAAIEALWTVFGGPTWIAVMELAVAGRTDASARVALRNFTGRVDDTVLEVAAEHFPVVQTDPAGPAMVRGLLALLVGLAMQTAIDGDRHGHQADVFAYLKVLADVLVPTPSQPDPDSATP